jgi:hypothetical protein
MKVNIDKTLEVTDEQRKQIADFLDGDGATGKRDATRDEMKEFIWQYGARWEDVINDDPGESEDPAGFTDQEDLPEIDAELESLL